MANESGTPVTDHIGVSAGEIWHLLATDGGISVTKIAKQIDAPRDLVMQAIGWLARENKVQITENKRVKTISLLPEEMSRVA